MYVSVIYLYQKKIYVLGINVSYVYIIARYQSDIKRQDYVYVNRIPELFATIKHYLRLEIKIDKNKILSYCETLRYM